MLVKISMEYYPLKYLDFPAFNFFQSQSVIGRYIQRLTIIVITMIVTQSTMTAI